MFQIVTTPPQDKGHFWPQEHHIKNLVEVDWQMLHTKYQSSMPSSFREEEFRIFNFSFFYSYVQTCDPLAQGQFLPQGHHMNKHGRGPLGDATNQISKFYGFQFQSRRILKFAFFVPMFQFVIPAAGPDLIQCHHMNKLGRSPLGDTTYAYQISELYAFEF